MTAEPILRRLAAASTFVDVAQTALGIAIQMLDAVCGAVDAHDEGEHPVACVASTYLDRRTLVRYLREGYRDDPCRAQAQASHAPVLSTDVLAPRQMRELAATHGCLDGMCRYIVVGPLTGVGATVGTLRVASDHELPRTAREQVSALCTQVSVRLAQLGFRAAPPASPLAGLTLRQREVARLVAKGLSNLEIAEALDVTDNAVKKHLKLIAATLDLSNRAELAALASRDLEAVDHLDPARLQPGFQLVCAAGG